jgi:hypothetical protein
MNIKLTKFIAEQLKRYNEEVKGIKKTDSISADMAIPEVDLK